MNESEKQFSLTRTAASTSGRAQKVNLSVMRLSIWIKEMAVLVLGMAGLASQGASLQVGQPFPVIALPAMKDGQPMSVADFRGRKLLLHLYAPW